MKENIHELKEESVLEMLEKQYQETDDKNALDYWEPISKIILESIELRDAENMSQTDLAIAMNTKQSVISRFENMGRLPNYDFIARLSLALNHSPGMTLYGDYMAVVPLEKQSFIKELADKENISTKKYVQAILDQGITLRRNICEDTQRIDANTTSGFTEDDVIQLQRNKTSESYPPKVTLALATPYQGSGFSLAS
jgi:transcriptional regulator with XRE-family HTH domain